MKRNTDKTDHAPPDTEYLSMVEMGTRYMRTTVTSDHQRHKPVSESSSDPTVWTWVEMQKFTGLDRKTIGSRANRLNISFLERPAKRGNASEKGLKEADLRRIVSSK